MDIRYAQRVLDHLVRKFGAQHAIRIVARERIRARLFDRQLAVVDDPAKLKTARCGRGSGKTTMDAAYLCLEAVSHPDSICPYITLTRKNAKQLLWSELQRINHECQLGMVPNATDLIMLHPNGSRIWLGGADNESQIEKYRGFPFRLVVLDECASFGPHIDSLIKDVIEPRLMDVNGTMLMNGTPGPVLEGAFYDADTDDTGMWSHHHWTVLENPFMPSAVEWLAERRRLGRFSEDDPTYIREWLGEWVADNDALCYHYDPGINGWPIDAPLPTSPEPWEYGLGVDIGYDPDPAAFCLVAWNRRLPELYVLESTKKVGLIPSQQAERVQQYQRRYPLSLIVVDAGALGKGIVAEWRQRYRIPARPARDKHLKKEHIQLVNNDLRQGLVKVRDGSSLIQGLRSVTWDERRRKPSDRYPNDETDAFEYIYLEAKHFCAQPLPAAQSAAERLEEEARQHEQREIERAQERAAQEFEGW